MTARAIKAANGAEKVTPAFQPASASDFGSLDVERSMLNVECSEPAQPTVVASGILPDVEVGILPPGLTSEFTGASGLSTRAESSMPHPPGWKPGSTAGRMPAAIAPLRVAVVDDNPATHAAVQEQLQQSGEPWHVTAYDSGAEALKSLAAAPPHVVLLDIGMPEMNGIECVRRIKLQLPQLPVVMLTGKAQPEPVLNALRAGAEGCLVKTPSLKDLLPLVEKAVAGGLALCPTAERLLKQAMIQSGLAASRWGLTRREEEVLRCLCRNGPEKDIADILGISSKTVHVHVRRIFQKLGVHDRQSAVREFLKSFPGGGRIRGFGRIGHTLIIP